MIGIPNTAFPLRSAPSAYLTGELYGLSLIGEWHLKDGGAYLKVRGIIDMKFQNLAILISK